MEEMPISMTAILVTVVATFVFGFIWYTLLFGKANNSGHDTRMSSNSGRVIGGDDPARTGPKNGSATLRFPAGNHTEG